MAMIVLRNYHQADASGLLDLFRETVRRVNCRDYTPEQVRAWASDEIEVDAWRRRFDGRFVIVAEAIQAGQPTRLAGFVELEPDGHIDRMYVSADHQRQGIGRLLLAAVVTEAGRMGVSRLFSEVSLTARPFFEAHGFVILTQQTVLCRGVELVNFRMERVLVDDAAAGAGST
jgi:putative acetyltransferase